MENAPAHNLSVGWLTRFMKRHGLRFQKDREDLVEAEAGGDALGATAAAAAAAAGNVQQEPGGGPAERARVDKLRQKATKRLREIEKEARELRKYLRRLDEAATNAQQTRGVVCEL
ncbi:hypothetical protein PHYPSEUDO_013463 [Phytophthora pseudosyringae]|uniref:HTH CENPB-type domain-containing protein n=1 Tax=Phytophthora pseudosyringae TaxID=221518 RepID=A0A8T1WIA0_9STRA|nr:hypothetical protein PHYPSEUDO_013463 [Phytophthora pseudosyringae]